jgi:hypothetical protein
MLVAPGSGMVMIPLGLAILATEFFWADGFLGAYGRKGLIWPTGFSSPSAAIRADKRPNDRGSLPGNAAIAPAIRPRL